MTEFVVAPTWEAGTEGRLQTERQGQGKATLRPPADQGWVWETERLQRGRLMQDMEK